jgi:GNAT superfamily N-acetyltransferase
MAHYTIRPAAQADIPIITHHRHAMFAEMGWSGDYQAMDERFGPWLRQAMQDRAYFGWLAETEAGEVVAGVGLGFMPRPPSPENLNEHWAFVYNVYTEPAHRRRGLSRQLMETLHQWCREHGLNLVGLNASESGRPLYEAMGYRTPDMLMLLKLEPLDGRA